MHRRTHFYAAIIEPRGATTRGGRLKRFANRIARGLCPRMSPSEVSIFRVAGTNISQRRKSIGTNKREKTRKNASGNLFAIAISFFAHEALIIAGGGKSRFRVTLCIWMRLRREIITLDLRAKCRASNAVGKRIGSFDTRDSCACVFMFFYSCRSMARLSRNDSRMLVDHVGNHDIARYLHNAWEITFSCKHCKVNVLKMIQMR